MVSPSNIGYNFNSILQQFGTTCRMKYYTESALIQGYDDSVTLFQSGTELWLNAVAHTLTQKSSATDALLLSQGRILQNDLKIYVNGSIITNQPFKICVGSPATTEYGVIPEGTQAYAINGSEPYKFFYVRALPNGSLIGE